MEVLDALTEHSATRWFDETSVPAGLFKDHSTRRGISGRIEQADGKLVYVVTVPFAQEQMLSTGNDGWIRPEAVHHVTPVGTVQFRVHFLR